MSIRDTDPELEAQLVANGGWIVFLLDIFLDPQSGEDRTQRLGSGFIGELADTSESGDNVFRGVGEFGSFTVGAESVGGLASGARYSISGVDPRTNTEIPGFRETLGEGLQERIQGRRCRLRVAALNAAGQMIGQPLKLRDDLGDSLTLQDTDTSFELVLTAEAKSADFKRLRRSTNSSADHKRLHPGSPPDVYYDDDRWRRTDQPWGKKNTDGDPDA